MERVTESRWSRARLGGVAWRLFDGADSAGLKPYLVRPAALLQPPARLLKTASATSPCEVSQISLTGTTVPPLVIKHYQAPKLRDRLKDLTRGSRAWRAARWAMVLRQLNVPAITPLAAGAKWWQPWDSYLVTRLIAPACTFHQYAADHRSSLERRPLYEALALAMARLHDAGISHGDAHWNNFILQINPGPRLFMVDLDGLRRIGRVPLQRAARDLQRLLHWTPASPAEQFRFLHTYCRFRREPVNPRDLLVLVRAEYQRSEQK